MSTMPRVSGRMTALAALENLRNDTVRYSPADLEEAQYTAYLVESHRADRYAEAVGDVILEEGRNLLNGKADVIQKLAGALLRIQFSDDELNRARLRVNG